MAQFFIKVLRWVAVFMTAYFIFVVTLFFGILILIGALQPKAQPVDHEAVLVYDLGLTITESPAVEDLADVISTLSGGQTSSSIHLHRLIKVLDTARTDPAIKGVLLMGNFRAETYGNSLAVVSEVRQKLAAFKDSGKFIWSYLDGDNLKDYYIKSVGDRILAHPQSMLNFRGLRAERMYFKNLFDRIGIEFQVVHYGDFKNAYDNLSEPAMTPSERLAMQVLVDDLWSGIISDISVSLDLNADSIASIADNYEFLYAEDATMEGLVDELIYKDELIDRLTTKVGLSSRSNSFKQLSLEEYADTVAPLFNSSVHYSTANKVAVVYVEGVIVDGSIDEGVAGADEISRLLRQARKDEDVKAVVVRVNSPGGSATSSEKIAREIRLIGEVKPVVVSIGGMAASGGYWISSGADFVYASDLSITGSIGVVGLLTNAESLLDKSGINVNGVQTSKNADLFSISRSKSEEELKAFEGFLGRTYDKFKEVVAEGRELDLEYVETIAQGRAWSGASAIDLSLADSEGGLQKAISQAAELARIGQAYEVEEFPKEESFQQFLNRLGGKKQPVSAEAEGVLTPYLNAILEEARLFNRFSDNEHVYAVLPYHLIIR